jgi:indoleamine 2,3-dioxygenase
MSDPSDLKAFDLSWERGFLPEPDPARALPAELARWDELAADLPKLLAAGRVRAALRDLPVLETRALSGEGALRRAMLVLSYFGHAFVWGGGAQPEPVIPASVAVPWCAVAARLGRPPVLSYASYALDNWRRLDPTGPLELGNFAILQNFLGGVDEDWFILVHLEIEARAARVLRELGPAGAAAAAGDARGLASRLEEIAAGIESLCQSLHRMPELCDPYVYYRRVRPYIHGWKDHPSLPEGVVYEGVRELGGRPQRLRGETGAQSGIVPALDAALGVTHADDPLRAYLAEMRDYMPPGHREFLGALEASAPVRAAVLASADADLRAAYDECLRWLESFRSTHLDYAARYIHQQRPTGAANPTAVGTGGTPFMAYLRKHRDETGRHRAV